MVLPQALSPSWMLRLFGGEGKGRVKFNMGDADSGLPVSLRNNEP